VSDGTINPNVTTIVNRLAQRARAIVVSPENSWCLSNDQFDNCSRGLAMSRVASDDRGSDAWRVDHQTRPSFAMMV
jgi:hypothetical protein